MLVDPLKVWLPAVRHEVEITHVCAGGFAQVLMRIEIGFAEFVRIYTLDAPEPKPSREVVFLEPVLLFSDYVSGMAQSGTAHNGFTLQPLSISSLDEPDVVKAFTYAAKLIHGPMYEFLHAPSVKTDALLTLCIEGIAADLASTPPV